MPSAPNKGSQANFYTGCAADGPGDDDDDDPLGPGTTTGTTGTTTGTTGTTSGCPAEKTTPTSSATNEDIVREAGTGKLYYLRTVRNEYDPGCEHGLTEERKVKWQLADQDSVYNIVFVEIDSSVEIIGANIREVEQSFLAKYELAYLATVSQRDENDRLTNSYYRIDQGDKTVKRLNMNFASALLSGYQPEAFFVTQAEIERNIYNDRTTGTTGQGTTTGPGDDDDPPGPGDDDDPPGPGDDDDPPGPGDDDDDDPLGPGDDDDDDPLGPGDDDDDDPLGPDDTETGSTDDDDIDDIFFTGTTSGDPNVYRHQGEVEQGKTYIFKAAIPEGEKRCTLTDGFTAVIGKPGFSYKIIRGSTGVLDTIQGGNVTILVQENPAFGPRDSTRGSALFSFTLECKQATPPEEVVINTANLSAPTTTYTQSGSGNDTITITLPEGLHFCSVPANVSVYGGGFRRGAVMAKLIQESG